MAPACMQRCHQGPQAAQPAGAGICSVQAFALKMPDRGPQAAVEAIEVLSVALPWAVRQLQWQQGERSTDEAKGRCTPQARP
jgi:hypothetical protein